MKPFLPNFSSIASHSDVKPSQWLVVISRRRNEIGSCQMIKCQFECLRDVSEDNLSMLVANP